MRLKAGAGGVLALEAKTKHGMKTSRGWSNTFQKRRLLLHEQAEEEAAVAGAGSMARAVAEVTRAA